MRNCTQEPSLKGEYKGRLPWSLLCCSRQCRHSASSTELIYILQLIGPTLSMPNAPFSKIVSWSFALVKWHQRRSTHRRSARREAQVEPQPTPPVIESGTPQDQTQTKPQFFTQLLSPSLDPEPLRGTSSPDIPVTTIQPSAKGELRALTESYVSPRNATENAFNPVAQTFAQDDLPGFIPSLDSDARIPREHRFWPAKPSLLGCISDPAGRPSCGGGNSDVWKCKVRFSTPSGKLPTEVAVKILRTPSQMNGCDITEMNERLLRRFQQEGITWFGLLDHPNIVPLIGWTLTPNLSFISPWYEQGNLYGHLGGLSDTKRLGLLVGIAEGLVYLHSCKPPVVHGDLKPENILLSDQGEPLLADFGLSTILGEEDMYTSSHHLGGSVRWMSPECMMGGPRSCQSDIYSFGSLILTIMTGELPHAGLAGSQIILGVCNITNPKDPFHGWSKYPQLQGSIGDLIRECWSRSPEARPPMSAVVPRLTALLELLGSKARSPSALS